MMAILITMRVHTHHDDPLCADGPRSSSGQAPPSRDMMTAKTIELKDTPDDENDHDDHHHHDGLQQGLQSSSFSHSGPRPQSGTIEAVAHKTQQDQ